MGINLEKAAQLGFDVKKLESRKSVLEGEIETLTKKLVSDRKEAEKNLSILTQVNAGSIKLKQDEINKKQTQIDKKLKTISTREDQSETIEESRKALEKDKVEIARLKKDLTSSKASCMEREELAKLRSEQLATIIKEMGKKPAEIKKEIKTKKK